MSFEPAGGQHAADPCGDLGNCTGPSQPQHILLVNKHLRDINPVVCGSHRCDGGHSYGPQYRGYYLLHYVLEGRGAFSPSPQREIPVSKNQLFVIRPNRLVRYCADALDPWHYIWIGFESSLELDEIFPEDVIDAPDCQYFFESMLESQYLGRQKEYFLCGKIYALLAHLGQQVALAGDPGFEYALLAKNYIEANFAQELSVEALAQQLHLSRSYFSSLFRRYFGKSPQQYLIDYRLQKASEFLLERGFTPGQTALACGYSSIFHFSRMFRKKFGVPPREYCKEGK